ncbi:NADH-ubiquinone oxidoreductase-related-like protein [Hibiscus syriacus]|uniref:NADH-ubiquinone oxidoreductase-related-like protein n=1 Tax=Hibiscus syriacus TaxID=106335 RepID=A0A6A2YTH9_HIBSY|nr:uncharacterized protein LOC120156753 [Hibiscus syriacus]KAE8682801.1 NADH-ubiquinone oxidoreductase-related-like protein [Hibiscus syriacus]
MIKTLNPCSSTAKTAEIMSRYRPIAPKSDVSANNMNESSGMSQKIRQSAYLRNLWPQLQDRPTRTRKKGRAALSSAAPLKKARTDVLEFYSPSFVTSPVQNLSLQSFPSGIHQISVPNCGTVGGSMDGSTTPPASLVTLPLLPCPPSVPLVGNKATVIDLNKVAKIPEEMDLLKQLQSPPKSSVIAPKPVRLQPVGSIISVGCIKENTSVMQAPKMAEEVEFEALPAIISDSNNKVRLVNSAYKQMVGQPECPWLDSIVTCEGRVLDNSCKRICGEVLLHLSDSSLPVKSNGFSCWVKIEWGSEGKKSSVKAFCNVTRSTCQLKDSLFTWRFHPYPQGSASHFRRTCP